jgi:hypothetical protein
MIMAEMTQKTQTGRGDTLFVFNDGPFPRDELSTVIFSLHFNGSVQASSYRSTSLRMECCDDYIAEVYSQDLPSSVSHDMDLSRSVDNPCRRHAYCRFYWNVSSAIDASVSTFSVVSNVTTYSFSNATTFIARASMMGASDSWICNDSTLETLETEPWTGISVGDVLLSEYNISDDDFEYLVSSEEVTSCEVLL